MLWRGEEKGGREKKRVVVVERKGGWMLTAACVIFDLFNAHSNAPRTGGRHERNDDTTRFGDGTVSRSEGGGPRGERGVTSVQISQKHV